MRRILFTLLCCSWFSVSVWAQADNRTNESLPPLTEAKRRDIGFLMELTGTNEFARQLVQLTAQQLTELLRLRDPNLPPALLDFLEGELRRLMEEELQAENGLLAEFIPVYHKYYTHEEIQQLLDFYRTPLGRKHAKLTPQVLKEGIGRSKNWVETAIPRLRQKLQQRFQGLLPM